jgi:hypothetical protein
MKISLRLESDTEEFDYTAWMAALSDLAKPHGKITHLLRSGEIIRIKNGVWA